MGRLGRLAGTVVVLGALGVAGGVIGKEGQPIPMTIGQSDEVDWDVGEPTCVKIGGAIYLMQGKEVGPHGMIEVGQAEINSLCGEGFGEKGGGEFGW